MRTGDLTDSEWELVGPLLPPERRRPGRPGHDNRPRCTQFRHYGANAPSGGFRLTG
jgi:transposase